MLTAYIYIFVAHKKQLYSPVHRRSISPLFSLPSVRRQNQSIGCCAYYVVLFRFIELLWVAVCIFVRINRVKTALKRQKLCCVWHCSYIITYVTWHVTCIFSAVALIAWKSTSASRILGHNPRRGFSRRRHIPKRLGYANIAHRSGSGIFQRGSSNCVSESKSHRTSKSANM